MENKRPSFSRILFPLLLVLPFSFTLMNCARESSPTGGPVDTIAPYAVFEKPVNNSQNISPQKITVKFNELIALDNVDDNCMISPMLEEKPTISVKKKKLTIDLSKQTLQPNTTYSFNFSNAIKDLSESNVTDQYIFAFSTGAGIDSMRIAGTVAFAESGKIPEKAHVLLYDDLSDTAFKTQKPRYVTQTTKKGEFSFQNIEAKRYKIYALVDSDNDFTFSQNTEKIAFLDTILNPTAERFLDSVWFTHNDTVRLAEFEDSIQIKEVRDSFNLVEKTRWSDQDVRLLLFDNEVWEQGVLGSKRISPYAVGCKLAAKNNRPTDISFVPQGNFQAEYVAEDSLVLWLTDSTLSKSDTAKALVTYRITKDAEETKTDTIALEQAKDLPPRLSFKTSIDKNPKVYPKDSIFITLTRPLLTAELERIALYQPADSATPGGIRQIPRTDYAFRPKFHHKQQSILKHKEASDRFALYFARHIDVGKVSVALDGLPNLADWCYTELDAQSNALLVWLKPGTDALRLKNMAITVTYPDDEGNDVSRNINNKKDVPVQKLYRSAAAHKKLALHVSDEQAGKLKPHEPIRIVCNNPVQAVNDTLFTLTAEKDSTETSVIASVALQENSLRTVLVHHTAQPGEKYVLRVKKGGITDAFGSSSKELTKEIATDDQSERLVARVPFTIAKSGDGERTYALTADWATNTSYTLVIPDSTFTDIFGDANDSVSFDFQSPKADGVGQLQVKTSHDFGGKKAVFVLRKDAETYQAAGQGGEILFENIPAGTYSLHCFIDENGNDRWDTGCLETKRQPEKTFNFKDPVTVKSEWKNSVAWDDFGE